jgi:hypothetical protein
MCNEHTDRINGGQYLWKCVLHITDTRNGDVIPVYRAFAL